MDRAPPRATLRRWTRRDSSQREEFHLFIVRIAQVGLVALRQARPRISGRHVHMGRAPPRETLRRWTRRYSSQLEEFHLFIVRMA